MMKQFLLTLAATLVVAGLSAEAFAQACPSQGQGGGGARNFRRSGSVAPPTTGFSSGMFDAFFRPGMMGMGGGGGGAGQRPAVGKTQRPRNQQATSGKRHPEPAKRSRVYDRVSSKRTKLDDFETRAARYNSTADAARQRGDIRVAMAFYRLASRTSKDFESQRAKSELAKLTVAKN